MSYPSLPREVDLTSNERLFSSPYKALHVELPFGNSETDRLLLLPAAARGVRFVANWLFTRRGFRAARVSLVRKQQVRRTNQQGNAAR